MKALSVKNPWASLIFHGKNIENRTWKTSFRGTVLIHASAKPAGIISEILTQDQFDSLNVNRFAPLWLQNLMAGKYITSAIIGKVDIVDCIINHPSIWGENNIGLPEDGEIIKPIYNWVLEKPVLFENPIMNIKGGLSLWNFDDNLIPEKYR